MEEPTEEQVLISRRQRVMERIKRYWNTPKKFSATHYRSLVMGIDMTAIMMQIVAYLLLQQSIKAGHLPSWTTDAVIIAVSVIAAVSAPYISWVGAYRRRRTMIAWSLLLFISVLLFYPVSVMNDTSTETCQRFGVPYNSPSQHSTVSITLRLVVLIIIFISSTIASVAYWCHGVAYIDENVPDTVTQHGILIVAKVLTYVLMYKIAQGFISGILWIKITIMALTFVINVPQLMKPPQEVLRNGCGEQGFITSFGRVITNKLAMSQIMSMSLLVAGFWGSSYYRSDIIKERYLFIEPVGIMYIYTDILYYHFVVLAICYFGLTFSKPMKAFNKISALKMTTFLGTSMCGMYIAISFFLCEKGTIAGLNRQQYVQPPCSRSCGCSPQLDLNPVCVFNEMVTYLSPCHAGCTGTTNLNGISVWSNCSCAGVSGGAVGSAGAGGCGTGCVVARGLYGAVWVMLLVFFTVSLMLQLLTILRSVDVRDKSVAVGVTLSSICTVAFGTSHILFAAMSYLTCSWAHAGVCKLHNSNFTYMTHGVSAAFSLISALLSFMTYILLRRNSRIKELQSIDVSL